MDDELTIEELETKLAEIAAENEQLKAQVAELSSANARVAQYIGIILNGARLLGVLP
jgi:cell division protein FtsB